MKNKDLIALLQKEDPEAEVRIGYDSLACASGKFTVARVKDNRPTSEDYESDTGVWFVCGSYDDTEWLFSKEHYGPNYDVEYTYLAGGKWR